MRKHILVLLLLIPFFSQGQTWKRYRREYIYSLGATNSLGDLGGANQIGTHFIKDFEFKAIRMMGSFGYRYRLSRHHSIAGEFIMGYVYGNDQLTQEPYRRNRNLIVRTAIFDFTGRYEYFLNKDKEGHRYNIKHAKGFKNIHLHTYAFVGAGFFIFNPQGPYPGGGWVSLQPLGTEGQNVGSKKKYKRANFVFPVGLGTKYAINRYLSIGLEASVRYTLTDYLDDVSGNYYDKSTIASGPNGSVASYFADPSTGENPTWTYPGEMRGSPKDKDTYMYVAITLNQKIAPKRSKAKF